jgi:2-succinyl-6-hydroxy-2,4-cyclohexadiene-1-carboxylate synthase
LYLDLPGHGGSAHLSVSGFEAVNALLESTLISYNILNYWLVGYSLGGRIAMFHAAQQPPGLCGLIVEGGHPGLQMPKRTARPVRRALGNAFSPAAARVCFCRLVPTACFCVSTDAQRRDLIMLRSQNSGAHLADMLEATSLAVQPDCVRHFAPAIPFSLFIW